jgi:hypothetical protein
MHTLHIAAFGNALIITCGTVIFADVWTWLQGINLAETLVKIHVHRLILFIDKLYSLSTITFVDDEFYAWLFMMFTATSHKIHLQLGY